MLETEIEIAASLATRVRDIRIARQLTQRDISERSGVSLSSYRRFEQTGRIDFLSLIRVAKVLHLDDEISGLFRQETLNSLDEIEKRIDASSVRRRVRPKQKGRSS